MKKAALRVKSVIESVHVHHFLSFIFLFLAVIDIINAMLFFRYDLQGLSGIMFGLFLSISFTQATLFAMYQFSKGKAGVWLRLLLIISNICVGWFALHLFWYAKAEIIHLFTSMIQWLPMIG